MKSCLPTGSKSCCSVWPKKAGGEWCGATQVDLRLLNGAKVCNSYQPGQMIFYQGNPCSGLYCIDSGTVAIRKTDVGGHSVLLRLVGQGETLGYRTFFAQGIYSASAVALEPCRICFIDREKAEAIFTRSPTLIRVFTHRLATDLEQAETHFLRISALPVRVRLAHLLLSLKDQFGILDQDRSWVVRVPLTRQDLADMVGARVETVIRVVSDFQRAKVLATKRRLILIPDLDRLLDVIEKADG